MAWNLYLSHKRPSEIQIKLHKLLEKRFGLPNSGFSESNLFLEIFFLFDLW